MKLLEELNPSQRVALGGLLVILLPCFFPTLFTPLGRASPSIFSVPLFATFLIDFFSFLPFLKIGKAIQRRLFNYFISFFFSLGHFLGYQTTYCISGLVRVYIWVHFEDSPKCYAIRQLVVEYFFFNFYYSHAADEYHHHIYFPYT